MKEIESEEQHRVWFCVILTQVCVCICVLQECVDEGDRKRGTAQGVVLPTAGEHHQQVGDTAALRNSQ